jgi:hypothetical protein
MALRTLGVAAIFHYKAITKPKPGAEDLSTAPARDTQGPRGEQAVTDPKPDALDLSTRSVREVLWLRGKVIEEPLTGFQMRHDCLGTAFLVGPDLVATAAHTIPEDAIEDIRFVFDFYQRENGELGITPDSIYSGKEILVIERPKRLPFFRQEGPDFAIVKLDRSVCVVCEDRADTDSNPNTPPVPIGTFTAVRRWYPTSAVPPQVTPRDQETRDGPQKEKKPEPGVYVLGHPVGTTLACTPNGRIDRVNKNKETFLAHFSTYKGNSGSPVYDRQSHALVGMVTGGRRDFWYNPFLFGFQSIRYPDELDGQERCTAATVILDAVREISPRDMPPPGTPCANQPTQRADQPSP